MQSLSLPVGVQLAKGTRNGLTTKSLVPGLVEFEGVLRRNNGEDFRLWDPFRSKIAAGILKGLKDLGLERGHWVLYLGASHGYTVSFVSDIIGRESIIFALDIAPRVVRDLVFVALHRPNIAPILANAAHPESFVDRVCQVDWLFQDIAQKDQVGIFLKNIKWFLKDKGTACLSVKARSVNVAKSPTWVYDQVRQELEKHVDILEFIELDPYQRDHGFFVVRKR